MKFISHRLNNTCFSFEIHNQGCYTWSTHYLLSIYLSGSRIKARTMGLYRFHPDYQKCFIKRMIEEWWRRFLYLSLDKKGPKIWTSEPSKIHLVPQKQWTDFCCGAVVCSSFKQRFSNNGTDEVASSPAPPSPHSGFPSPSALPSPQYSLFNFCSFILLSLLFLSPHRNFFVIFSTLGTLSSLISPSAPSPPSPPYFSILFQDRETPPTRTFSLFFLLFLPFFFFPPAGNSRQLVCLAADCTHARPNVETDTPP